MSPFLVYSRQLESARIALAEGSAFFRGVFLLVGPFSPVELHTNQGLTDVVENRMVEG